VSVMKFTLLVLAVALVAKDTSQLNDPYVLRGLAQVLCMAVGGSWVLANLSGRLVRRYWPVWGYLAALTLSAGWSVVPFYVWLQLASLAAVLLFSVAYFEASAAQDDGGIGVLLDAAVALYGLVAVLSLVVMFTHPAIAYGAMENGDAGMEYRFRGLFPKAGMLASAAGLTLGLAWFGRRGPILKGAIMAVCGACLALALSRTFWVALIVAALAVYWMDRRAARKWGLGLGLAVLVTFWLGMRAFDATLDFSHARFLRSGSITTLTGRVGLWEKGMQAFYRQPLLGYGYTAGASGLTSTPGHPSADADVDSARNLGKTTLHNGYLQSMLDSGVVGTSFYLLILVVALVRLSQRPLRTPRERAVLFGLVYFAVANATQNVIYSASVFDSIMFYGLAIYAMRPVQTSRATANRAPARLDGAYGKGRAGHVGGALRAGASFERRRPVNRHVARP
jgi:hypothetical protein